MQQTQQSDFSLYTTAKVKLIKRHRFEKDRQPPVYDDIRCIRESCSWIVKQFERGERVTLMTRAQSL